MSESAGRDASIDVAKGIAIVLIVVGHVVRGLSAARLVDPSRGWYEEVDTALYVVHLPVFAFTAALFLADGVRRRGARDFLSRRLGDLAWIYVLWTLLQGAVQAAAGGSTNVAFGWTDLPRALWVPLGQFWFLPTLAVLTVLTVAVAPGRSPARAGGVLVVATGVSLACWGHFGTYAGTQAMGLAVFFAAGAVIGHGRASGLLARPETPVVGAFALVVLVGTLTLTDPTAPSDPFSPPTPGGVAAGVVASGAAVVAILVLSRLLAPGALAFVGQRSLPVYVAHLLFAGGARIVLTRLGVADPWVIGGAAVVLGLAGPLGIAAAAERYDVRWVFAAPRPRGRAAAVVPV